MPRISESFPSRFLSADDLPAQDDLILTIKGVKVERLNTGDFAAGRPVKEDKLIVEFHEASKSLALNKTNALTIKRVLGNLDDTEEWTGRRIALYRTNVKAFGELVAAVRVRDEAPSGEAKPPVRILGPKGAKRLLEKLTAYGKTYPNLITFLKANHEDAHESIVGKAIEDVPETCFEAIQGAFEVWDKSASVAIADGIDSGDLSPDEIDEDSIPF